MRMPRHAFAALLLVPLLAVFAGCAPIVPPPLPTPPAEVRGPPDFPEDFYRRAAARGEPVFRIDQEDSLATVHAYRGGSLARLGHDHVVSSRALHGYVLATDAPSASRADLYLRLDTLQVDDERLRQEAGFDTQPSAADIAGTRRNMLEKVLESERYPFMSIRVRAIEGGASAPVLASELSLHGVTRNLRIPATIEAGPGKITVSGHFSFRQTDFGMTPYAVLGGAIQVQDRVELRFRIQARRLHQSSL